MLKSLLTVLPMVVSSLSAFLQAVQLTSDASRLTGLGATVVNHALCRDKGSKKASRHTN